MDKRKISLPAGYDGREVVRVSMNRAASREEFVKLLADKGYSVDWQDKHKHLTFMDHDGNKVRDTNLNRTFRKLNKNKRNIERDRNQDKDVP